MDFDNNIAIYIQIVDEIKKQIISGNIKPGERLPSVRDLAIKMKVNPNTVQKALMELEDEKIIYTMRTNGKYVTDDKVLIDKIKEELIKELRDKYFKSMNSIGFNKKEAIKYLEEGENE